MSDVVEKTAGGATRTLFGALGFILLMLGLEGMTGAAGIQFGVGLFLTLLGAVCFYAAFFWESAKKVLSAEAQEVIGKFAQSRVTWFGMLFLVLETLILSPFIEAHRWPFSFPSDPAVYRENSQLREALKGAQKNASKWEFASNLRNWAKAPNGELAKCTFALGLFAGLTTDTWFALQPMLDLAHWELAPNVPQSSMRYRPGITMLTGSNSGMAVTCATTLGRVLADVFPSTRKSLEVNQVTPALTACKNECIELDIAD